MNLTYVFLLNMTFTACHCNSSSKLFHAEHGFANQMCPSWQVDFFTVAKNALWCVRECTEKSACRSLIYLQSNNSCFGIKSDNPFSTYSSLTGAVFYRANNAQSTTSPPATAAATAQKTTAAISATTSIAPATTNAASSTTPKVTTTSTATTTTPSSSTTTFSTGAPFTTTTTTPSTTSKPPTTTTTRLTTDVTTTTPLATTTVHDTTPAVSILNGQGTAAVANLQNSRFTASSEYSPNVAHTAKLNNTEHAWVPGIADQNQWIQVDFGDNILATHVKTKGHPSMSYWTAEYRVITSTDCKTNVVVTDEAGNDKIFIGNMDGNTAVTNTLEPPIVCRCFRINSMSGNGGYRALRFDVFVHTVTQGSPIAAAMPDSQFNASSSAGNGFEAWQARLDSNVSCWRRGVLDSNQWLQIDLENQTLATHIVTKGNPNNASWVTSYNVFTSTDCENWDVQNSNGTAKVYDGNIDGITAVQNALDPPVIGRCFRINPQTSQNEADLRFDVLVHEI